jgi:OmpA-OmpF porin, OOP family
MRSSRWIICVAALAGAACATRSPRICAPLESWSSPAYTCHVPPPPVAEAPAAPAPESAPPPPPPKAALTAEKIELSEIVQFETDSSVIREESKPILQAVADIMKNHPEIEKVRVEGYTDNTGTAAHNLTLSRDRAKSVKDYLVRQGVDAKRLETEGYGETKPVADNNTNEGRYQNRRVDFVIVKRR